MHFFPLYKTSNEFEWFKIPKDSEVFSDWYSKTGITKQQLPKV